jgi:hypothetical protein
MVEAEKAFLDAKERDAGVDGETERKVMTLHLR